MHIIDRRLNPSGKSLANRQRFLRRAKAQVQRAVHDLAKSRDLKELEQGGEVAIPLDGVREPQLRRSSQGGLRDAVLPGNKTYIEGDRIDRPSGGGGRGGREGATSGEGEDDFRFVLSRDEFLSIFLDDLELPDLAKRKLTESAASQGVRRAGYSPDGSPANLALQKTMRNALARRIALRRPSLADVERVQAELDDLAESGGDPDEAEKLAAELKTLQRRRGRIPYIDQLDLRYRRFVPHPRPMPQAVMFCLMDVSGSMTEHMKDLAKRFYMLLFIFLTRRYKHVDVVFIRHTHEAKEVDEDTFFHSTETGGTMVSSALAEMKRIVAARYNPADWNIYAAQASDGDNAPSDSAATAELLQLAILPVCQYYAYLEVGPEGAGLRSVFMEQKTILWRTYEALRDAGAAIAMRKVFHRQEIFPVFREMFQKREAAGAAER